ncbi:MAG: tetratricopeptide repeat protein, partial [Nannocystaceae bacterium]
ALLERGDPGESARLIARWRDAGGAFSDVDPATRRRARRLEFEGILASGDVERAVTFAQHAMDQGAEEAPRWILRAAEQASGATRITTLRKLVAVRPEDPRALSALEAALRQVDDTAGLVALLEHRATTGTVLDRLTALRSLAAMLPNVAAAEADRRALVQRILALDPTDPESLAALASMERDGTRRRELWERLIQVVAADDPRRALALCELAEAAAPEDPERARALLDTLLASDPSNERALTLGLEIAPALDDPSWTRRCALAILAAGTTEFSRPPLNLTLARACVDMERFDEALVASGRAATTASAGSDEHIDAARLWADLAGNYGSDAEHRLAARERRRAVGSGLGESELLEELQLYERDPESREEAVTFVCRSLNSWAPPLALAASSWLEQLPTEDSAEGTARTDALAAVAVTLHDEALRRKIVDTAISLARRYERPDTVLQLLDSVDLTRWSEALVELRRWALARAGRREPEIRRIERAMLDPDTPLHPSTIQRFKACFDGPAESVHALRTLIAEATADRAAQLARHALSDDTVEISDEGFYDLLEALAGCSMTVPVDWE